MKLNVHEAVVTTASNLGTANMLVNREAPDGKVTLWSSTPRSVENIERTYVHTKRMNLVGMWHEERCQNLARYASMQTEL